jgi:hypothetical protein
MQITPSFKNSHLNSASDTAPVTQQPSLIEKFIADTANTENTTDTAVISDTGKKAKKSKVPKFIKMVASFLFPGTGQLMDGRAKAAIPGFIVGTSINLLMLLGIGKSIKEINKAYELKGLDKLVKSDRYPGNSVLGELRKLFSKKCPNLFKDFKGVLKYYKAAVSHPFEFVKFKVISFAKTVANICKVPFDKTVKLGLKTKLFALAAVGVVALKLSNSIYSTADVCKDGKKKTQKDSKKV